jgi:hypothetical protein
VISRERRLSISNNRVCCLVFLEENGLLEEAKLATDAWEAFVLDVASSKLDRDATTRRLRKS